MKVLALQKELLIVIIKMIIIWKVEGDKYGW